MSIKKIAAIMKQEIYSRCKRLTIISFDTKEAKNQVKAIKKLRDAYIALR